jgi:flagellar protein FlaJ
MKRILKLKNLLKKQGAVKKPEKEEEKQEKILEKSVKEDYDREAISKIVERMKQKYIEEGVLKEDEAEESELKKIIAGNKQLQLKGGSAKELALFENPMVRLFGKFYLFLESPISKLTDFFYKKTGVKLENDLLAAGMNYSVEQYLSLALSSTLFITILTLIFLVFTTIINLTSLLTDIILLISIPLFILFMFFLIPNSKAKKIGQEIDKQLPFALRHMSIEIRAGVGIYRTMESIATSGYGPLSDGFRWVLYQVEKGVPTEEALEAWAARTKSQALGRVVSHIVRALRTGGNLSEIMVTIAEDVSFERKMKIADFAEKLNLLGLFLMFATVVGPVMLTILTTIASSPTISQYLGMFSFFTIDFLMLTYFLIVPAMVGIFIYFIKSADPG